MRRLQSGSVLLIGLLLFGLTAAFVLVQLDMLFWYRKAFQSSQIRQENRVELERLLATLRISLPALSTQSCFVKAGVNHPHTAVSELESPRACVYKKNNQSYHYWVEDLGVQPCLLIRHHDQSFSTHHWRVSAGVVDAYVQVIQIQFAIKDDTMLCPENTPRRFIESGIQSWRTM